MDGKTEFSRFIHKVVVSEDGAKREEWLCSHPKHQHLVYLTRNGAARHIRESNDHLNIPRRLTTKAQTAKIASDQELRRKNKGSSKYVCPGCNKQHASKSALDSHTKSRKLSTPIKCPNSKCVIKAFEYLCKFHNETHKCDN